MREYTALIIGTFMYIAPECFGFEMDDDMMEEDAPTTGDDMEEDAPTTGSSSYGRVSCPPFRSTRTTSLIHSHRKSHPEESTLHFLKNQTDGERRIKKQTRA